MFLQRWITEAAIMFIVRQISKYGQSVDWTRIKIDLKDRVKQLVPGDFFDAAAVEIAMRAVDAVHNVVAGTKELERITKLALDGKWDEALTVLKNLIVRQWVPADFAGEQVFAACGGAASKDVPSVA